MTDDMRSPGLGATKRRVMNTVATQQPGDISGLLTLYTCQQRSPQYSLYAVTGYSSASNSYLVFLFCGMQDDLKSNGGLQKLVQLKKKKKVIKLIIHPHSFHLTVRI